MPLTSTDPSVPAVLEALQRQHADAPFLALGQTALWDEPTKAVWRRLLDAHLPEARLIAGVHDTDYFAKTTAHLGDDKPYVMLPHDDGRTRDLWSAAGELSSLFGSESVPTRQMFLQHGVPFDWLAQGWESGKDVFYTETTTAWGWRGIVHTESHNVIAHDVPMQQIGPALLEQLDWGFAESLACLEDPQTRAAGEQVARMVRSWVTDFLETCSDDCRLSDLYQTLLPKLYTHLLGSAPAHFSTTTSTELFQFHRATAVRPRFRILDIFLNPQTRAAACRAYDQAVGGSGSGIYMLAEFGDGAIPFDLVIPGLGRGTVRLTSQGAVIETTPDTCRISSADLTSAAQFAAAVEEAFGPDCVLVGKAVTLIDMLAAEFRIVFHETASGYTPLTRKMNEHLAQAGISLALHPIVRLEYPTWNAVGAAASAMFRLPPHLARAFGCESLGAREWAERWQSVIEEQRRRLQEVRAPRKVRDLLSYLEAHSEDGECWCDRLEEYESNLGTLKQIAAQSTILGNRIDEHRAELAVWKKERLALEERKGTDWRANIQPLRERIAQAEVMGQDTARLQHDLDRQLAIRANAFNVPLDEAKELIRATRHLIGEFRRQRRLLERSPEALAARARILQITREAQMARLRLVRDAYLTVEGLEHTNLRPTAWWIPMVSPQGDWLEAMAAGTQARLEALS